MRTKNTVMGKLNSWRKVKSWEQNKAGTAASFLLAVTGRKVPCFAEPISRRIFNLFVCNDLKIGIARNRRDHRNDVKVVIARNWCDLRYVLLLVIARYRSDLGFRF